MGWFGINAQEKAYWERFKPGDRLDVIVSSGVERTYASRIKEIQDASLLIDIPRLGNIVLDVEPKTQITVSVYTDEGVFKFTSSVMSFLWDRGACVVAQPKSINRIQRRQSFRLEKIIPVRYAVLMTFDADSDFEKIETNLAAVTKNVSEGGILMVLNERFMASETFLKIQIDLDEHLTISAIVRVLDQKPHAEVPGKVLTRVQFVTITDEDKEAIRKFVLTHSRRDLEK